VFGMAGEAASGKNKRKNDKAKKSAKLKNDESKKDLSDAPPDEKNLKPQD
jgi:hypothetical protein